MSLEPDRITKHHIIPKSFIKKLRKENDAPLGFIRDLQKDNIIKIPFRENLEKGNKLAPDAKDKILKAIKKWERIEEDIFTLKECFNYCYHRLTCHKKNGIDKRVKLAAVQRWRRYLEIIK